VEHRIEEVKEKFPNGSRTVPSPGSRTRHTSVVVLNTKGGNVCAGPTSRYYLSTHSSPHLFLIFSLSFVSPKLKRNCTEHLNTPTIAGYHALGRPPATGRRRALFLPPVKLELLLLPPDCLAPLLSLSLPRYLHALPKEHKSTAPLVMLAVVLH
jgi:hypothetical protein